MADVNSGVTVIDNMYTKNCIVCNNQMFRKKKSEASRENWLFCSCKCKTIHGNRVRGKGFDFTKKCLVCPREFKIRKSLLVRSCYSTKYQCHVYPEKTRFCSTKCSSFFLNKFQNPMRKEENRIKVSGPNNWNWRGGKSNKTKIRRSLEMKRWRKAVFERDDYTCQECRVKGGKIQAHHIKSFSIFPEHREELSNGVTLCLECHKKTGDYLKHISKSEILKIRESAKTCPRPLVSI